MQTLLTAFPDRLTVVDNLLFIDAIELEVIKSGAKVLIIDNMSAISQDNEKSGNAAKLMNKVKDLQRRNKLTVLLMAHTPKIVQGEAIIANNLAGSSNLYNLADSVMAVNMTTMADDIRYIKQLKSRYNEIQYHKDNVVAIKFSTRPDGLKGFEFLNYETEDELIKPVDKSTKADEDREIINLINHFGFTVAQIADELRQRFAPDVELSTYKERIKKRVQRLRAKGLIKTDNEFKPIETPLQMVEKTPPITESPINVVEKPPIAESPINVVVKTSPIAESPINVVVKTSPIAESPINVVVKTSPIAESPINVVVKTSPIAESPINVVVKTPTIAESPINMVVKTPTIAESPINMVEKTPTIAESPINMVEKTSPFTESPINVVVKTPTIMSDEEKDWLGLQEDILKMKTSPRKLTEDYSDIMI